MKKLCLLAVLSLAACNLGSEEPSKKVVDNCTKQEDLAKVRVSLAACVAKVRVSLAACVAKVRVSLAACVAKVPRDKLDSTVLRVCQSIAYDQSTIVTGNCPSYDGPSYFTFMNVR